MVPIQSFGREREMLPLLVRQASALMPPRYRDSLVTIGVDIPVGPGVPDVLIVGLDSDAIRWRLRHSLAPLTRQDAVVIAALADRALSIDELSRRIQVPKRRLTSEWLPRLTDSGLVKVTAEKVSKTDRFVPVQTHVIAIEAKLRDWRKGVGQARRYLRFANRVFLALDVAAARPAMVYRQNLRSLGVGLLTADAESKRVNVVSRPRDRVALSRADFLYTGELMWSQTVEGKSEGDLHHVFGRNLTLKAVAPIPVDV